MFFKTVGTLTGLRINIHSLILKKKISKYSISYSTKLRTGNWVGTTP
ncbi:hypothetical protein LEP1GSC079_2572 [Leptospira interrogans str. FPW1039]|uniref:Uncharacterized protein n=1 Tax=Leptospira interrogans str. FPW1039 TaxID=1193040 RepID=A0A0F6I9I0_LEPIR|nr:hypothetical protein LEP1GSC087_3672 [Leptospira interrogans serovar Bataviae str. L1111]EMJ34705.1 hypothetical protein LEP1GSC079_2572 [Leptospira interrogans str. FPW1039]EMN37272.1 hypothetical protein LEP1GSC084_3494 [Leptospira interrogans serovar Medanensis str. L0448]EMN96258.1 hypothetical protein LEP1GSC110_2484 [Leptospira interrogans serovar Medanensis str. UT053]EMO95736.1 hypothetical protein LEP1GSC109_0113 [Leptospira interrogans str. UI 13372]